MSLRTAALVAALAMPSLAFAADWTIDASHSGANFKVRHLMVSNVRGEFSKLAGTVQYDEKNPGATKIEATIDVSTVNTREPKRDEHLRSPDFFDVAKFPTIAFKSKKAVAAGKGLSVTGDLTMHGVTKEVVLALEPIAIAKDPWGNTKAGTTATTKVNRKDFGLGWNKALEAGGMLVGEDVEITLDIELGQAPAPAAAK